MEDSPLLKGAEPGCRACRPVVAHPDRHALSALAASCGASLLLAAAVLLAPLGVRVALALACWALRSLDSSLDGG
jgi:hypothetical protein